jgi:hypothetical protein
MDSKNILDQSKGADIETFGNITQTIKLSLKLISNTDGQTQNTISENQRC